MASEKDSAGAGRADRRAGGISEAPLLERARAAYRARGWAEAYRCFAAADATLGLEPEDLDPYAWSATLLGHDEPFIALLERLYDLYLRAQEELRAARCAFWAGHRLSIMRETGRAGGWLARAERLVGDRDCVERGYLLLPVVRRHQLSGSFEAAQLAAEEAARFADRFGDADLSAFARSLQGNMLLRLGQVDRGLALIDEAMISVTSGGLSPVLTGLIYCISIAGCSQVYVMDRARQWTTALTDWCSGQPDLVPFHGTCLVHRAELLQLGGAWGEAIEEAERAAAYAPKAEADTAADSFYQQGEIHRLRGDFEAAERAYRAASQFGRDAQPGLGLLRLAQGRSADALMAVRRALSSTSNRLQRARLLPAAVEIALAAGELNDARSARDELATLAGDVATPVLGAMAAHARGAVALADRHAAAAIEPLRHALQVWNEVGAPYIAARLRVLLADAYRALGDLDSAGLEIELARETFTTLGAAPDLGALGAETAHDGGGVDLQPALAGGLSARELEVLRLVSTGKTNKVIAHQLYLSEKTVDRHVSNIFVKLNVASRAAATAYAYQHGLV